jgi:hypothetical protein
MTDKARNARNAYDRHRYATDERRREHVLERYRWRYATNRRFRERILKRVRENYRAAAMKV